MKLDGFSKFFSGMGDMNMGKDFSELLKGVMRK